VAVAAFLDEKIPFKAIPAIIEQVLADASIGAVKVLADVLAADEAARCAAQRMVETL
jgi:1-deoxy-D-xylulose-5-phosphate reductoisomerase